MKIYAAHYPQLMNQLLERGAKETELVRIKRAYEFSMRLFDGSYRAQNVPLLNHLVRTSSIVIAEHGSIEAAAATLLHSAYIFGRFGDGRKGERTEVHRKEIIENTDGSIEEIVALYHSTPFRTPEVLKKHIQNLPNCPKTLREVLLMRLANELEDYLDLAMIYRRDYPYREILKRDAQLMLELARGLGHDSLALELETTFRATLDRQLPECLKTHQRDAFELPQRFIGRRLLRILWSKIPGSREKRYE